MRRAMRKLGHANQLQQFSDAMLTLHSSQGMQTKTHITRNIQVRKERIVLKHHTNLAALGRHMNSKATDLTLHQHDTARLHRLKSGDGTQHRRLAATRWAEQTDDLASIHIN